MRRRVCEVKNSREIIRSIFRVWLSIILISSLIPIISTEIPIIDNASASSSWKETSYNDFNSGTLELVEIEGTVNNANVVLEKDEWHKKTISSVPGARTGHAIASVHGTNKVVLFGGDNGGFLDDTWVYDFNADSWTRKNPASKPSTRFDHAMINVFGTDKMVLFGGNDGSFDDETWIYDLSDDSWTQQSTSNKPSARGSHAMAGVFGTDKVVLFGGNDGSFDDETWVYDLSDNSWTKRTKLDKPGARMGHAMSTVFGTDKIILFGGNDGSRDDETWEFDLGNDTWKKHVISKPPRARFGHAVTFIYNDDKVLLFGGDIGSLNNESWEYDLSEDSWLKRSPLQGPSARFGHAMAAVECTDSVILFGGYSGNSVTNDTWVFEKLADAGTYTSKVFDTIGYSNFKIINWNANIIAFKGTDIKARSTGAEDSSGTRDTAGPGGITPEFLQFQIRTAKAKAGLVLKNFVGPDGSATKYYRTSPADIWSGHTGDRFIQYTAYFATDNKSAAELKDVTVDYNILPESPTLIAPSHNSLINISTPTFTWTFTDKDSSAQSAFQVLIDDDYNFKSIDYNSGLVNSPHQYYTTESPVADGIWYWTVRARDNDGDWGPYSGYYKLTIDATPPEDFTPAANPGNWTINTTPEISFETTDVLSGMDHFEVSIDGGDFEIQESPFILSEQSDGIYNITVRAYDVACNYIDRYVFVYIDTGTPQDFIPNVAPSGWTTNTQPEISFDTTDGTSSIDHYELSIDGGTFSIESSPCILNMQTDGAHDITVRAFDAANNFIDAYTSIYIDTKSPFITHTPVTSGTKGYPITFTAVVEDEQSGVDNVTIYIKKPTEQSYTSISLNAQGSIYSYELPALQVTEEGIEYYIKAGDYTLPSNEIYYGNEGQTPIEPASLTDIDISITRDDVTPPSITHVPITQSYVGDYIHITSTVTDDASGVDYAELYYKSQNESGYTTLLMDKIGKVHLANIPAEAVTLDGIEYYIKCADTASSPNVAYFGADGQVVKEPGPSDDIDIVVIEEDTTAPTILEKYPIGSNVSVGTSITITFTEAMDKKATSSAISITPTISGSTIWEENKLIFTPDIALDYNTEYTVTLDTNAKDLSGNNLLADYYWLFTTTLTEDITYPAVIDKLPTGSSVPVDTTISMAFSEPMKKLDTQNAFSITPSVAGIFNWVGTTLIYTPNLLLTHETQYFVSVSIEARDLVGNSLESEYSWQFVTTGNHDKTRPTVIDIVPFGMNVNVDTSISVAFSEQMMHEETKYAFSIYPSINGVFDWLGTTLTFIPSSDLAYSTQYNVSISVKAKDLTGNCLEQEYNWSFITQAEPEATEEDDMNKGREEDDRMWDYWEPIVTILTIVVSLMIGLIGFFRIRKKQSKLRHYFNKIDDTYNDYKENATICEKELNKVKDSIKGDVKKGKIEEFHFLILDKKIDENIKELKGDEKDLNTMEGYLPYRARANISPIIPQYVPRAIPYVPPQPITKIVPVPEVETEPAPELPPAKEDGEDKKES